MGERGEMVWKTSKVESGCFRFAELTESHRWKQSPQREVPSVLRKSSWNSTRVLEAEAEAVVFVSRFQIGGWDSY